jgi:hypothetical protein
MNIFEERKKDQEIVRERQEVVVIKPNLKKENHYTLPTMT